MSDPSKELKKSIAIGAVWMTALRLSYRFIGIVSTLIMARLLTPEDFGVVAIAMSFFALIEIFSQFGFQTVLVQIQAPTKAHFDTAWTFNALFGLVSAVVLASAAPYVGDFYEYEKVTDILYVVCLLFVINGCKSTGVVEFQKNLTFDKEFRLYVIPKLISFFITIGLALAYQNFWALVFGNVIWKVLELIASYVMHSYRPRISFEKRHELFNFSKWLMLNSLFNFLNTRTPELMLGKLISPHATAVFSIAYELASTATMEVIANLNRAIYPGYAKVATDLQKLKNLYQESIYIIAMLALPIGFGIALVAEFLIPVVLGDQWLEAGGLLPYVAVGGAINALQSNFQYLFFALGKPRFVSLSTAIRASLLIISMFFFVDKNGLLGAAQAFLLASLLALVISNIMIRMVTGFSVLEQLGHILSPLMATAFMCLGVWGISSLMPEFGSVLSLVMYSVLGAVFYISSILSYWCLRGMPGGPEKIVLNFLRSKLAKV